ncbi:MAG: cytochrome c oxidase subunit I [Pseudomonadota bacterium]|nr:cytochrome c oxidase subunit I [Pseudomonadota bacterium]
MTNSNSPSGIRHPTPVTPLSRYWLLLGVMALAVAGLFAFALVFARTPELTQIEIFDDIFHKALVVHVDLSVLVWFLSIACLMWSLLGSGGQVFPFIEEAALISFGLGALLIALSPLDPRGVALMSNYIPVLMSPVFFLGLALVLCGVLLMLVKAVIGGRRPAAGDSMLPETLRWPLLASACVAFMAITAFVWSFRQMPADTLGQPRYDLMFWGGGHGLQFVHVQVMMVCWVLLTQQMPEVRGQMSKKTPTSNIWFLTSIFSIGLVVALATPLPYLLYDVTSSEHRLFFTRMMTWAGGIAPLLLGLLILPALWPMRKNALWATLAASILLFFYGGALGGMIRGQNVTIPAHYHGSIVGVTLAFMGMAYLLLPQFGWRNVTGWRLAFWQPIIYGGGQILHITGLAISGGYGVLRKTPGGFAHVSPAVKAAMGLMGIGGLLAIAGGFMFVYIILRAAKRQRRVGFVE